MPEHTRIFDGSLMWIVYSNIAPSGIYRSMMHFFFSTKYRSTLHWESILNSNVRNADIVEYLAYAYRIALCNSDYSVLRKLNKFGNDDDRIYSWDGMLHVCVCNRHAGITCAMNGNSKWDILPFGIAMTIRKRNSFTILVEKNAIWK